MKLTRYHLIRLIQRSKARDEDAMREIIRIFSAQLECYSKKLDGDDTSQDLMFFLFILIQKLCLEKITSRDEKVLLAYIAKSLKHEYFRLSRRKTLLRSREAPLEIHFAASLADDLADPLEIEDLLGALEKREAVILRLFYFYGYSIEEISRRFGISRQTVNKIKLRALRKLKDVWRDGESEPS